MATGVQPPVTGAQPFLSRPVTSGVMVETTHGGRKFRICGWRDDGLALADSATHYGVVLDGTASLEGASGRFQLRSGMYFAQLNSASIGAAGRGRGAARRACDFSGCLSGLVSRRWTDRINWPLAIHRRLFRHAPDFTRIARRCLPEFVAPPCRHTPDVAYTPVLSHRPGHRRPWHVSYRRRPVCFGTGVGLFYRGGCCALFSYGSRAPVNCCLSSR